MRSPTINSARPFLPRIVASSLVGALSLGMAVGLLASSAWLISMAATMPPVLTLQVAVVSVRFFGLSRGIFRYGERIWSHDAILRAATRLQLAIYRALVHRPPFSSSNESQGKLLQQLTADIETVQDRWVRIFIPFVGALLSGWAGIGIISYLAPSIGALVLLLFTFALILIPVIVGRNSIRHTSSIFDAENAIANQVTDACKGHLEAKMYGYQDQLVEQLHQQESAIIKREKSVIRNGGQGSSLLLLFMYSTVILAFLIAVRHFANGELAGVNIAVVTLVPLAIFDGIPALIAPLALIGKIRRATSKIDDLIESASEITRPATLEPGQVMVKLVNARARWSNGELSHQPITTTITKDHSLHIRGESGIGKTSLALAIAGLIDYEGSIRINGIEARDIKSQDLATSMTVCLQDDHLFASSIKENLKIAKPDASDDELVAALAKVELTELIKELPEGIDTHIGAFGTNFSGGEKQRMRLARIFLRTSPLYILDEPIEHLERKQGERILNEIFSYCEEKTLIIISHQEIKGAQNVLVLSPQ